ncbi:MAG: site-2 protease family protein [Chloroflexia bacterium]|nr:site-2 protease family protein [Chloroflexia bacterium]
MPLGPFAIISLFYVVIGIRVLYRLIRSWSTVWDRNFTQSDRSTVDEAAFFVLVPVSVALHELGHTVAIWAMGGTVVDFGFYGFAGYVSYFPAEFSLTQRTIIAAAGSLVNLLLCLAAFGLVFLRKPPMRAAHNELLLQFAFLSGLNAFIAYPLLDLASGMNGDWRQMYDSGVPWLSGLIVVIQAAVLYAGYWLATNARSKARMASLTDVTPGYERGLLGGLRPAKIDTSTLSPAERTLQEAASRVTSGWAAPVKSHVQRFAGGTAMVLEWSGSQDGRVAVAARSFENGRTDIVRLASSPAGSTPPPPKLLHQWPTLPSTEQLTMGLRVAMEAAERGS